MGLIHRPRIYVVLESLLMLRSEHHPAHTRNCDLTRLGAYHIFRRRENEYGWNGACQLVFGRRREKKMDRIKMLEMNIPRSAMLPNVFFFNQDSWSSVQRQISHRPLQVLVQKKNCERSCEGLDLLLQIFVVSKSGYPP
jgi:hypothetical protein